MSSDPLTIEASPQSEDRRLAEIRVLTPISIVIPTYREVENIPHLLDRIEALRERQDLTLELLLMDDGSDDGSVEAVESSGYPWARMVVRQGPRGLSAAVLDGLRLARYPVVVVMDADLSHPPEKIPDLILGLAAGQQFMIGSRYVPGGSTDDDWGFFRWLNSRVATWLASPLTQARDPMAGFFAFRRDVLDKAHYLNPIGYKIGLELIVKCGLENVGEVPIRFTDRLYGQSKLTLKEQLRYLQHLGRLYLYKFAYASNDLQFAAVGASGVLVNLLVLSLLVALGLPKPLALACGILTSLGTNFFLDRRFSLGLASSGSFRKQWATHVRSMGPGAALNYLTAFSVSTRWPHLPLQVAALCGVAAGLVLNYLANR